MNFTLLRLVVERNCQIKKTTKYPQKTTDQASKTTNKYEALRDEGMSKEKAARIANTPNAGKKGGKATQYENRTKEELYQQVKKIGM